MRLFYFCFALQFRSCCCTQSEMQKQAVCVHSVGQPLAGHHFSIDLTHLDGGTLMSTAYDGRSACSTWHIKGTCQLCDASCSEAEDYLEVLRVNVVGPMLVSKHFLPLLRKSGGRPKIVNISSSMGSVTRNRENRKTWMVSHSGPCMAS